MKKETAKLAGSLRQGERAVIYLKDGAESIVRRELAISGRRIKELTGSQRVPDDADGVARLFDALEARYTRVWLEVERHRQVGTLSLGELIQRMPRVRDVEMLGRVVAELAEYGRIAATPSNRYLLDSLRRNGLIENPMAVTKVRGFRVSTVDSDALWRLWRKRP